MKKDKVILVDLDGTIALPDPEIRDPYNTEFEKLIQDSPNKPVIEVIRCLWEKGYKIIYITARDSLGGMGTCPMRGTSMTGTPKFVVGGGVTTCVSCGT